jgi:hypothetical protein
MLKALRLTVLRARTGGMRMKCVFLLVNSLIFSAGVSGVHAEPTKVSGYSKCFTLDGKNECVFTIRFVGEISSTSANEVAALLDQKREWIGSKQLIIDSPGGNVDASMTIGRLLRKNRMAILVAKGEFGEGACVSACVLTFAGAVKRLYRGNIGIHRPYLNQSVGAQLQPADQLRSNYENMLQTIRAYLRDMNVSERLAEDMLKIAPANVRYLSNQDLNGYGLSYVDPIEQETIDLEDAQSIGLDRREYIRRQALQDTRCGTLSNMKIDDFVACRKRVMKSGQ